MAVNRYLRPSTGIARVLLLACCAALACAVLPAGQARAASPAWSVTPSPSPHGADQLDAVSCTSTAFCMAVGSFDGSDGTLAETWSGTAWSVTTSPSPGGDPDELFGVSCTSPSFCMAVGWNYNSSSAVYQTLAETWDGTAWSITPTPSPAVQNVLFGVSCTSPARCTAVGYQDKSGFETLVETWNGTTWTKTPSPDGGTDSVLQGVSCLSAVNCTAVGWYEGTSGTLTLAEIWNGSTWSVVSSPNPGSGNNELLGVSCTSTARCQAAGFYSVGFGPDRTLAESWNGSTWSAASTPDRGSRANNLEAVSCPTSSHCVAVGYNEKKSGDGQTLIERWNGSGWSIASSPDPAADDELLGVQCPRVSSCQAVGYDGNGSLVSEVTLVETGS